MTKYFLMLMACLGSPTFAQDRPQLTLEFERTRGVHHYFTFSAVPNPSPGTFSYWIVGTESSEYNELWPQGDLARIGQFSSPVRGQIVMSSGFPISFFIAGFDEAGWAAANSEYKEFGNLADSIPAIKVASNVCVVNSPMTGDIDCSRRVSGVLEDLR